MAKQLLAESDLQVKEIAERLGLRNVSYFCQLFRRLSGITPYQYKKQLLNHRVSVR